jgi:hypothetical protein
MKQHFHFHFYIRLFILVVLGLLFSFFIYNQVVKANFPGGGLLTREFEFHGWAWSPNIGWISLNCYNDFDGDGQLTAADNYCLTVRDGHLPLGFVDYATYLDTDTDADIKTIRAAGGCAWAGNVGWWICFDEPGDPPDTAPVTLAPTWGVYLNGPDANEYYNGLAPPLVPLTTAVPNALSHSDASAYHASILPLEGAAGWSHELGFPIANSVAAVPDIEGCFNCQDTTEYRCYADMGSLVCAEGDDDYCIGQYTDPAATCGLAHNRTCENCLEYTYDNDTGYMTSVVGGYDCTDCTFNGPEGISTRCTENAYNNNQNSCATCSLNDYYSTPGLIMDYASTTNDGYGYMCGWAWNQADCATAPCNGIGWIQFSPRITGGNNPYFAVDAGNIYSKGSIRSNYALPLNKYNAYIIEAGGDIHQIFASSTLEGLSTLSNQPLIDFPALNTDSGQYVNILGKIDFEGLITDVGTGKNKYGSAIDLAQNPYSANWLNIYQNGGKVVLDNRVYYMSHGFVGGPLGGLLEYDAGDNAAGVIVINNSTIINKDSRYSGDNNINDLDDIPSVVWVINGDLVIGPTVTEISGTFIVLGEFNTAGGGNQLTINGSVIAESFVLSRTYTGGGEPAEKFINDGRLQINPPAGLQNFARSLPKFSYDSQ